MDALEASPAGGEGAAGEEGAMTVQARAQRTPNDSTIMM
jgi:hypothetical protein